MHEPREESKRAEPKRVGLATSFSPFELAQTAIALAQMHGNQPDYLSPKNHFGKAGDLLLAAEKYLASRQYEATRRNARALVARFLGSAEALVEAEQPIPFAALLLESDEPENSEPIRSRDFRKKPATCLGSITSVKGLRKAIRRHFPKELAHKIIRKAALSLPQLQHLQESRAKAIERRARNRVKNQNIKKSQPG